MVSICKILFKFSFSSNAIPSNILTLNNNNNNNTNENNENNNNSFSTIIVKDWIKNQLIHHIGFLIESGIEAFPNSIIQFIFLIYYHNEIDKIQ